MGYDAVRKLTLGLGALAVVVGLIAWFLFAHIGSSGQKGSEHLMVTAMIGQSMFPTLRDGQRLLVDTNAYVTAQPKRGDIVAIMGLGASGNASIRRVIAIPGDQLRIAQGIVYINGNPISEPYVPGPWTFDNTWPADGKPVVVPANDYFVLGDNRNHSSDSRSHGFVEIHSVTGRLAG